MNWRTLPPPVFSAPPRVWNMLFALYKAGISDPVKKEQFRKEYKKERVHEEKIDKEKFEEEWEKHVAAQVKKVLGSRIRSISTG